jgi:hypothetical protein
MAEAPLRTFLDQFAADFSFGADLLKFLRRSEAKVIRAERVVLNAPRGSWALHVRLPSHLEDHFGISRQFVAYCARTADLQPRDVTQLRSLVRGGEHSVQPDFALFVSEDHKSKEKLQDWSMERSLGMTLVAVDPQTVADGLASSEPYLALRRLIEQWISSHNLYDERDPVTGDRFFGRGELLRDLDRKLAGGRGHIGLFGLRRIGKTSVLLETADRLRMRPRMLPVFLDLESTAGAGHAAVRLGNELGLALADRSNMSPVEAARAIGVPADWEAVEPRALIMRIADGIRAVLREGDLRNEHLILMLDEAEILLPTPDKPAPFALEFFRSLRGLAQETRQLTILLAGVNATPTESPLLANEDNPLFGLLSIEYLGPLQPTECEEMIRRVGRRMQVRWDAPALSVLVKAVGAHPLLARLAASDVVTRWSDRPLRPNIAQVEEALADFPRAHSQVFEQMILSLRRYYPDELDLMAIIADGDLDFASDLIEQQPLLHNHLKGYGVIDAKHLGIGIPVLEQWLKLQRPQ